MSSLLARTGRERQRYDNHFRLVSGCIPYRLTIDVEDQSSDAKSRIEVLMVSSPNRNDLVFPKGGWEDDESIEEAAGREAFEEAGVRGILKEVPLGVWEFRSKSREDLCSLEGGCRGHMFALEVTEELDTWPEQANRHRRWLHVKEAFELCRYEWMQRALEAFLAVMSDEPRVKEEVVAESQPPPVAEQQQLMQPPTNCLLKSSSDLNALYFPLKRVPLA